MQFNHINLCQLPEHPDYDQLREAQNLLKKAGIVAHGIAHNSVDTTVLMFEGSERLIINYYQLLDQFPELLV